MFKKRLERLSEARKAGSLEGLTLFVKPSGSGISKRLLREIIIFALGAGMRVVVPVGSEKLAKAVLMKNLIERKPWPAQGGIFLLSLKLFLVKF